MDASSTSADNPTIVLVHGAFADASSWNGVAELLIRQDYTVVAPANPLRGIASTPPISPARSTRSTAPCCWSATRTGAP